MNPQSEDKYTVHSSSTASCKSIERAMKIKLIYTDLRTCKLCTMNAKLLCKYSTLHTSLMLLPVLYFYTNLVNNVFSLQLTLLEVLISTQLTNHQRNHHECKCSLCKSAIQFLLTLNKSLIKFRSNVAESWNLTLVWPTVPIKKNFQQDKEFFFALCQCSLPPLPYIRFWSFSWSETHWTVEKNNVIVKAKLWHVVRHSKTSASGN